LRGNTKWLPRRFVSHMSEMETQIKSIQFRIVIRPSQQSFSR
jgi:hypothetical protein